MTTRTVDHQTIKELASLPYGEAARWIRQNVDPLWGLSGTGEKSFEVWIEHRGITKTCTDGTLIVQAEDEETAKELAGKIVDGNDPQNLIKWGYGNPFHDSFDDEEVELLVVKEVNP
ncbi:MAG: hypothetical protein EB015_15370 [Methylocystaceae bacterium]|nr:hypothetical protein [Methylocystaceae bacterium]